MAEKSTQEAFARLVNIMNDLRQKCPWDQKQTIHSLRSMTIEETYELADAILEEDWKGIKEELGDLILHIVFYSVIGKEQNQFTLEEVLEGICEKLIYRHPHIYGNIGQSDGLLTVHDEEDVKRNWEKLKLREGKDSVLSGVPVSLPATVKAMRLQEKAGKVGFEWDAADQVWEKVREEMKELEEAVRSGDRIHMEEEFGDLFFSLINYARFLQIDTETALEKTNRKFTTRFKAMEKQAIAEGKTLQDMTLEEMDAIWNSIKKQKQTD
jgi:MazG family protein